MKNKVTLIIPSIRPEALEKLSESLELLIKKPKTIIIEGMKGYAEPKNRGLEQVETEYVWFLDDDTIILQPECLEMMTGVLELNSNVGAVGGERMPNGLLNIKFLGPFLTTKSIKKKAIWQSVDIIGTNNMLTRTDLLREYGGFKDCVGEDKLYCMWLTSKGYHLVEDDNFGVLHLPTKKNPLKDKMDQVKLWLNYHKTRLFTN